VIYIDSSVALTHLFGELRVIPARLWDGELVSSRLLQYEVWNRVYARGLAQADVGVVHALIDRILLLDLDQRVLARALQPFPVSVRTLDGLHLASIDFLRAQGDVVELASFDRRLLSAARAMDIPVYAL